ncbi:MAG: carboxypeptidase regulatory-like domain-containing protein [Thermoanaerobaculia bacterium]
MTRPTRPALALLGLCTTGALVAAAGSALAQETIVGTPVRGTVQDLDGRPLPEAEIVLSDPENGTEVHGLTDADGRWTALVTLGPWSIEIRAADHFPARGAVHVLAAGATPPVFVRLRSLDEVAPFGWEGGLANLRAMVERANDLLSGGRPAAARAAYETALPHLDATARTETLRAIARTHYLEGDLEAAVATFEQALAATPEDPASQQLYAALMEQLGRAAEAKERLTALARDGASALPAPPAAPSLPQPATAAPIPPDIADLPTEAPTPGRLGRYRTRFAEASPLGSIEELTRRFGLTAGELAADTDGTSVDLVRESFHVYVPETYRPGEGWGLLVWVSPTDFGGFVRDEIAEALTAHELIWVGADAAGNRRRRWDRAGLALDAAQHLPRLYDLDPGRLFIAGYSGGGRLASSLALTYPEVFSGALALFGADTFHRLPVPDRPGSFWPPRFPPPPADRLVLAKESRAFVLLTGELDFNRPQTQEVDRAMLADGFQHTALLEIPGASHYTPVPAEWLDRALAALDPD